MFDISLIGDKALQRKFNAMGRKTQATELKAIFKEAMEPVKVLAKSRAPVDLGVLKKSIRTSVRASQRSGVTAQVRTGTRKQLRIPADATGYYPAAHEYGTRFIPAQSFLRSALSDRKDQVLSLISRGIARVLARVK